jgi:hypothetical protein
VQNEYADYKLLLRVLGYALIEIRACDDLGKAQALADVFHNVPAGIASGAQTYEIRERLDQRAVQLGFQRLIDSLFDSALRHMKQ